MENIEPNAYAGQYTEVHSFESMGLHILHAIGITILIVIPIILIICMWRLFKKNDEKGWKSLIPIYNVLVLLKMGNLSYWFILLPFSMFIPFIGLYVYLISCIITGNKLYSTLNSHVLTAIFLFPFIVLLIYSYLLTNYIIYIPTI